jgi:hypothetical protein
MNSRRLVTYSLVLTCFAAWHGALHGAGPVTLVEPLTDQYAIEGCSWNAASPALGSGRIFLAELDESKVLMHIDGQDTVLTTDKPNSDHALNKVGDTIERTYRSNAIVVTATYTATWVCQEDSESCEVTEYTVTYTVSKNGQQQIVQAQGSMGC